FSLHDALPIWRNTLAIPVTVCVGGHAMNRATLVLAAAIAAAPVAAGAADGFLDRARNAVQEAGKDVQTAAKKAGRSMRDFLTDHPDLNRDIVVFGEQVGV